MKKLILLLAAATTVLASCGGDDGDKYSSASSFANSLSREFVSIVDSPSKPAREIFARGNVINVTMRSGSGSTPTDIDKIANSINNEVGNICAANDNFRYSEPWLIKFKHQEGGGALYDKYIIDCSKIYLYLIEKDARN